MRGSLEVGILDILSSSDRELQVREVQERFNRTRKNPLAYTTIMTVLKRLTDKGAAVRRKNGRGYTYRAMCSDVVGLDVRKVLTKHGTAAVACFVDQVEADPVLHADLHARLGEVHSGDGHLE
ncbi:BlaI/MecI/CopY family transcriptional regulator [Actinomadura sp. SCN-SB]|uniref:BlaI/MecI/CopY family transcriptional regulator n=1 Tax=Actinomadura sp. SCN-SB TaxID=3373092 RepID=UPI003751971B